MATKALRNTERDADQQVIDAALRRMPDSVTKRNVRRSLGRMADELVADLRKIMDGVTAGAIRPDAAGDRAQARMIVTATMALLYGFRIVGLPDWTPTERQRRSIVQLAKDEADFFRAFMRQISSDAMSRDQRVALYGGITDDAFWRGWSMGLPTDAVVHWRLSAAEHCIDCLALAARGPYSRLGGDNPLPTVPRNGDTRCLTNCRCYLVSEGAFDSSLRNIAGVEVIAIGGIEVNPMAPGPEAAAALYQELAERYAYELRLAVITGLETHIRAARQLERDLEELADSLGHTIRQTANRRELLEQVERAMQLGGRYVDAGDITDDLVLAVATAIAIDDTVTRGRIQSVSQTPPQVTFQNGDVHRLDAEGRSILFLED